LIARAGTPTDSKAAFTAVPFAALAWLASDAVSPDVTMPMARYATSGIVVILPVPDTWMLATGVCLRDDIGASLLITMI